jgi:hypothetical protein
MITGFTKKIFTATKNIIIICTPSWLSGVAAGPIKGWVNLVFLKKWIKTKTTGIEFNDYFTVKRVYSKRYELYQFLVDKYQLKNAGYNYLEFGVSKGHSFKWWLDNTSSPDSKLYGFDTFEGLPEAWGSFKKGDMIAGIPDIEDPRAGFVKGLFQDTLYEFAEKHSLQEQRTIYHLDADLFTATVFVLTTMHRFMKPGDILLFDEFNVPNHEFEAFRIFEQSFNLKYKVVGAVNNYFQVALEVL